MSLAQFLDSLFEDGRVTVADPSQREKPDWSQIDARLTAFEAEYRRELPGQPPLLSMEPARWGATMLYRAAGFLVHRDVGAEVMAQALGGACPDAASATHYSVDLTFRFLGDLLRMARTAAAEDPLVEQLLKWGRAFPLSSVGLGDLGELKIDAIMNNACLSALYVDRIVAAQDFSRLAEGRVQALVTQALGMHPELSRPMAARLASLSSEPLPGELLTGETDAAGPSDE